MPCNFPHALRHGFERVVNGKIAMIRSPDLSRNDGRYSKIAVFLAREVAPGFTPRSGVRAPSAAGEVAPELARSHDGANAKSAAAMDSRDRSGRRDLTKGSEDEKCRAHASVSGFGQAESCSCH
jgi:hypothetical protein